MKTTDQIVISPHSKDSEMMILGCMLISTHALNTCCKILHETDFYFIEHKEIFQAIRTTWNSSGVCDVHLTYENLKQNNKQKSSGGAAYLTTLAQFAGTSTNIEEYIDILKQFSNKRKFLELSEIIRKKALSDENPQDSIISIIETLKIIERNKGAKDKFPIKFLNEYDDNFFLVEPPKKAMLLDYINSNGKTSGFLPKGIVAMLVGTGGVGKSHLLSQLAVSVATGTPFLDTFMPTKHCGINHQGNVFLGLGENQYDDIHRLLYKATKRLRNQGKQNDEQILFAASQRIAAFSFCGQQSSFLANGKPSLYFREFKMRLEEKAPKNGWNLIILDPVSRIMGADAETDNASATQFIALLEELTIDLPGNPTVLFAHHTNKSASLTGTSQGQQAARGSSALTDGVRWQCNYSRDTSKPSSNVAILKMTKSNFTQILEEIQTEKEVDGYIKKLPLQNTETVKNLFGK